MTQCGDSGRDATRGSGKVATNESIANQTDAPAHILLVEDDEGDALLASLAVEQSCLPLKLSRVTDGVEAMKWLRNEPPYPDAPKPDLILLDLNMPRMDGHETLAAIKSDPRLSSIPVVIMTTSAMPSDISRSYDAQANCYICKPTELNEFMDTVISLSRFWCKPEATRPNAAGSDQASSTTVGSEAVC